MIKETVGKVLVTISFILKIMATANQNTHTISELRNRLSIPLCK